MTSARRWPRPACTRCSPTRTCRAASSTGWRSSTSRCSPSTRCATRASRSRWSPPTTRRSPARRPSRSGVDYEVLEPVTDAREALGHPRWNLVHNGPAQVSELSRERAALHPQGNLVRHLKLARATPSPWPTSWSPASTRSGCRTRPSSARSPGWPCRPRTAASSCTSRRNGCTWTSGRSARRSACRRRRCGSRWPAWAARSAAARTCRCTCTRACWRCTPASR